MIDDAGQEIELGMWYRLLEQKAELLAEVKRLGTLTTKLDDVLTTLDEMIRGEKPHAKLMKALEQGLGLPETWEDLL